MLRDHTVLSPSFALMRSNSECLRLIEVEPVFDTLFSTSIGPRWIGLESPIFSPTLRRIVELDHQWMGLTTARRVHFDDRRFGHHKKLPTYEPDRLADPTSGGDWLLKCGLWVDPRIAPLCPRQIGRLAGPLQASLWVERLGLRGYITAVILRGLPNFAPALDPWSYVQQVDANCIGEPLLTAYLQQGAHPVGICQRGDEPAAVLLRWSP